MPVTARPGFLFDLLQPFPGRLSRSVEISIACTLVVIVSMTFEIPSPATSAYLIFFAAKENSGLNVVMSLVFGIVVTAVVGILFLLAPTALNHPTLRIGIIGLASMAAFFLTSASKLAPLSGTVGLVVAFGLDLLQDSFVGEVATRGFLYAWLFVVMPMAVFALYSLAFGRHPEVLLRQGLANRLRLCAGLLDGSAELAAGRNAVAAGNALLGGELGMVRLFRRETKEMTARLGAVMPLTYALLLTLMACSDQERRKVGDLATRLDRLAEELARSPVASQAAVPAEASAGMPTLPDQARAIVTSIEVAMRGPTVPVASEAESKQKTGFFAADAFTNPEHIRFALKGSASVLICYLLFNLLDWPGIHTCLITCFIVTLKTLGETLQKMTLRITGCLAGAALGLATIVFVLPGASSITDLAVVIAFVTFPAAWIAVGRPRVSYIGFQVGFALFLCILQGSEPKFDLTLARDRIIGILLGNVVVYVVATRVFPVSILGSIRRDLGQLLARCRALVETGPEASTATAMARRVAEMQAMLGAIDTKVAALDLETRRAPASRPHAQAVRLCDSALRRVVWDLSMMAAHTAGAAPDRADGSSAEVANLALALDHAAGAVTVMDDPASPTPVRIDRNLTDEGSASGASPSRRAEAVRACRMDVERLDAALRRYGRLLRDEHPAHA